MPADDLAEIFGLHEPVGLHILEDPAPALFTLEGGDLIEGHLRRAGRRVLRVVEGRGDLLAAGRQFAERAVRTRLRSGTRSGTATSTRAGAGRAHLRVCAG